jgi:hypothetical protein
MKKLLALLPIAAIALTGCGGSDSKPSPAPPALIQPTETKPPVPGPDAETRMVTEVGSDNTLYEVTGKNSNGMRYRCYITETYQGVSQTCFEYGPAS